MTTFPIVRIEGLAKSFGPIEAVAGVDLDIERGEFFALLGGSGCGKSTLLRLLAGFEAPDRGRILIDGQDMAEVPPYARPVNMMFQSYALFPHMDVRSNVAYGLKREGVAKAEISSRVAEALTLVRMADHARRRPNELSGGQRQRVALARALVKRPKLLLLDEPLAALDRKLREETRFELVRLQEQLGLTFVMVTHDQEEAMSLAGRMAVMDAGRIVQAGAPRAIYEQPASRFVANFIGVANLLEATVTSPSELDCAPLRAAIQADVADSPPGARRWLALRPEKITLFRARPVMDNAVCGEIVEISYEGDRSLYRVKVGDGLPLIVSATNSSRGQDEAPRRGEMVWLGWPAEAAVILES